MNQNLLASEAKHVLIDLSDCISQLTLDEYNEKISLLSDGTIGQHTRHIIELFQQLLYGYNLGTINYDHRKRDLRLQEDINFAMDVLANVIVELDKEDKSLKICSLYNNLEQVIESNYNRELMYNIEHCIHHQAIIKIGLLHINKFHTGNEFGVAKSTLEYRKQCAQ